MALLLITFNVQAQNWLTTGNTGINSSKNFLGTKDSASLVFRTFNQERMRISYTGRVGIGTKSPTQALDVHGNINTDAAVYASKIGIGTTSPIEALDVHGNMNLTGALNLPVPHSSANIYADEDGLYLNAPNQGSVIVGPSQTSTTLGVSGGENAIAAYSGDITIYAVCDHPNPMDFFSGAIFGNSTGNIGVLGMSDSVYGVYGSTGNTKSYAGYFDGSVYTTGFFTGSDEKLKQNIQDVSSALSVINQLHPKTYQFKQDNDYKLMKLPQGQHYGLIAQDVEKVLPDLVKDTKFNTPQKPVFDSKHPNQKANFQTATTSKEIDFKALNYIEFIPLLIKGMQEQQQSIDDLKKINQQQQDEINQLKNLIETKLSATNVSGVQTATLSSAALLQNTPNPYKNSTNISYSLPAKFSSAQIIITDNSGKVLKQVNVAGAGKGSVNIDASSLASGSYNYSLLVDGRLIDTKQMVLQK